MKELKQEEVEKIKIGFCLELLYRQNNISDNLKSLAEFVQTNEDLFSVIDVAGFHQSIEELNSFFLLYTDVLFYDIDKEEKYCDYNKIFY